MSTPRFPGSPARIPTFRAGAPSTLPDVVRGEICKSAGKYARGALLYAFEAIGGADALAEWADENKGDFYTKMFIKLVPKEVEVADVRSLDSLMDALDGDYETVEDENHGLPGDSEESPSFPASPTLEKRGFFDAKGSGSALPSKDDDR